MSMRDRKPILSSIMFEDGLVVLGFIKPDDVKMNGAQLHQQLYVPRGDDYDDEIEAIEDAVQFLIADIGEDWPNLKAMRAAKRKDSDSDDDEEDEDE